MENSYETWKRTPSCSWYSLWYDKHSGGKIKIINVKEYKLEDIQPPVGIKSVDWIKSGLKPGKW